jgi:hypothetical protein
LELDIVALRNGSTPEEIAIQFSVLNLEDIYSAIAYYLNHRQEIDSYLQQRNQQAQPQKESGQAFYLTKILMELYCVV